ncbi:MAG: FAD-dependent oxidoreductase [Woeseiaceae bacterium]|nr:FAD-dependent oxidoreductase [Woeseiaceae bacterium]
MRIAVIGTGIAGNVAAYTLRQQHDITVFEAADYVGGHTNTVTVTEGDREIAVDTGFIVFNDRTYPNFTKILDDIGQASQASVMSFSVQANAGRLEYCGSTLDTLFAQRSNLLRPSFHRMIRDILRFNREAPLASAAERERTLGAYLEDNGYSRAFGDHYLIPMAAAIWSSEPQAVPEMPLDFLVRFFGNHGLLQLKDRPQWRVIKGGSREYVKKLVDGHRDRIRLSTPVRGIKRHTDGVEVVTASGDIEWFDAVFVASHSDQALAMLEDATVSEREVLGAIQYQPNEAVLHTDSTLMPRRRKAWAAWNYHVPQEGHGHVSVTYHMNTLQSLDTREEYLVTLNNSDAIDPSKVLKRIRYEHPMYTLESVHAQLRQAELNCDRTFFCGAYWRNGFHEDGVVSALDAVRHFEERLSYAELHLRRAS